MSGPEDDSYDFRDSSYTLLHLTGHRPILDILAQDLKSLPFIDADPTQTITSGWWDHFLNDGSAICSSKLTTRVDDANSNDDKVKDSIRAIIDYYNASLEAQNTILVPFGPAPLCAAIIMRDIATGKELFVTYGHRYWLEPSFLKMGTTLPDTDKIRHYESLLAKQFKIWTEQIESCYSMEPMQLHLTFQCIEVSTE
jgi:hypothetical protein